jgi:transposase
MNRPGFAGGPRTRENRAMTETKEFSTEVRERAVRLVREQAGEHTSQWATIQSGLSTEERQRLQELEREIRELRRANEILRKASACFAQAELDRRGGDGVLHRRPL